MLDASARSAKSGLGFRPDVQGLRALAVLLVLVYHAGLPLPGGWIGVDVFLVISGFVITQLLVADYLSTERLRWVMFWRRRIQRLVPALAVVSIFTMVLGLLLLSPLGPLQMAAQTAIAATLGVANWVIAQFSSNYFAFSSNQNPLLNTWSLSVEEQFYLVFPLAFVGAVALSRRRYLQSFAVPLTIILLLGSTASFVAALAHSPGVFDARWSWLTGFFGPVGRAWEFGIGALTALLVQRRLPWGRRLDPAVAALGFAAILGASLAFSSDTPWPSAWTLIPTIATAFVIASGTRGASKLSLPLTSRPALWLGNRSYSIYLWHWPLIVYAGLLFPTSEVALPVAAAVSLAPAALSYRFVERPLRNASGVSRSMLITGGLALTSVIIALFVGLLASKILGPDIRQTMAGAQDERLGPDSISEFVRDFGFPCQIQASTGMVIPCVESQPGKSADLYLVGDSHAYHLWPGFVSQVPWANIVFVDLYNVVDGDGSRARGSIEEISTSLTPGAPVILSQFWSNRPPSEGQLASAAQALTSSGHRVYLSSDIASFPFHANGCIGRPSALISARRCDISQESFMKTYMSYLPALKRVVQANENVSLLDLSTIFCDGSTCDMRVDGDVMYIDDNHLNLAGSTLVVETILSLNPALVMRSAGKELPHPQFSESSPIR